MKNNKIESSIKPFDAFKGESDTEIKTEIELVFEGKEVKGMWYHRGMGPIICALCKEDCGETKCHNVNPYCG